MVNLVATIPGARKERIVIAGHYDTKLFREFRFVGASDGGSSAAFLIELARVLKARKNALTIELLFLDGEEARRARVAGHRQHLRQPPLRRDGAADGSLASLKALVLVDMIGDRDLTIRRDTNSTPWLTDIIWDRATAATRAGLHARVDARSRTTTCRSSRPACRRSTSSISTTRRGTRQGHARRRQRAEPADRRRRPARRAARDRGPPDEISATEIRRAYRSADPPTRKLDLTLDPFDPA